MFVYDKLVNKTFVLRLIMLGTALVVIQGILNASPIGTLPWHLVIESFFIGLIALHKLFVVNPQSIEQERSRMGAFLQATFIYFIPASILWFLVVVDFFLRYLPRTGFVPTPVWLTLTTTIGVFGLAQLLLQREFLRLRRPPP